MKRKIYLKEAKTLYFYIITMWLLLSIFSFSSITKKAIADEIIAKEWKVEKAIKEVEIRGYTRSIKSATISSEVSGRVVKVNYEIGDTLSLPTELTSSTDSNDKNSSDYQSTKALKSLPFAEIDTTFVDFEIQSTKIAIAKIKTQLKQIDSRIAYLRKEFKRKEELFTKGRATEVIRDAASQELDQAVLERETVKQGEEALDVSLNQLIEKKKRHTIWGHSNWVVTDRKVEAGEMIQAGMPLGTIHDFRKLVVPLAVSNEELYAIKDLGITFDAILENEPVKASIYYINPAFNEQTRKTDINLIIHDNAQLENKNSESQKHSDINGKNRDKYEHRGGLSFILPLSVKAKGLRIHADAVQNRYENPKVYIKGKTEPVAINIIDKSGEFLIIADQPELMPNTILIEVPVKKE